MIWKVLVVLPGDTLPESYSFPTRAAANAFAARAWARHLVPLIVGPVH